MSGDPIDEYLARLRASLRTPPDRAEQILAEAEDHLRESAAAGESRGLTEREAQEAAIATFGQVRAVVRAHRRPAAVAAELCLAAGRIATVYLLVVAATSILMWILAYVLARQLHVLAFDGGPRGFVTSRHGSVTAFVPVTVVGFAIAGAGSVAGYCWLRRMERRRRFAIPALAAVVGSVAMALAFTLAMIRTMVRQGRGTGTADREAHYA